jgi:hypothetical protein
MEGLGDKKILSRLLSVVGKIIKWTIYLAIGSGIALYFYDRFFESMRANDTCYFYMREDSVAPKTLPKACNSGDILDYRIYDTHSPYEPVRYDALINAQNRFCNFNKEIVTVKSDTFIGFSCKVKNRFKYF